MSVPEAMIVALTRALEGLNTSDGVGMPLGYQPWADRVTGSEMGGAESGGKVRWNRCVYPLAELSLRGDGREENCLCCSETLTATSYTSFPSIP